MRKYLPLLICALMIIACKNQTSNNDNSNSKPAPTTETTKTDDHSGHNHADHAGHSHAGHDHGDHAGHSHGDQGVHVKADASAFLVGMWEFVFAMGAESDVSKNYVGRWIKFERDNSFTSGRWDEQTNKGVYEFVSEPKRVLTIKYAMDEDIPSQWEVQGSGGSVVLKGGTALNSSGTQVKMSRTTVFPTKD